MSPTLRIPNSFNMSLLKPVVLNRYSKTPSLAVAPSSSSDVFEVKEILDCKRKIHFHVFLCIIIFYSLFYMACSVCAGFMRIEDFDWMLPFRHTTTPSLSSSQYLVHVISAVITFFLSGLLFVPVVGSMVWDYSATVTFIHVIVCCVVTQEFPVMWQWWLQIGKLHNFITLGIGITLFFFFGVRSQIYEGCTSFRGTNISLCVVRGCGLFLMIISGQTLAYFTCRSTNHRQTI